MSDFGIGSVRVDLQKKAVTPGEAVEGTLLLTVNSPTRARGLFVTLAAHRQFRAPGGRPSSPEMIVKRIYHHQQQLDTERLYQKTVFPVPYLFRLLTPPVNGFLEEAGVVQGAPAAADRNGSGMAPEPFGPIEWSVEGYLDLPLAYEVMDVVKIRVGEKGA